MKKATSKQIVAVASISDAIGFDGSSLYGVTAGQVKRYAVSVYRDSFHNLLKEGILKYNDDFTYTLIK
jgi:hypothetical protein